MLSLVTNITCLSTIWIDVIQRPREIARLHTFRSLGFVYDQSFAWILLLLIYLCNLHTPVEKVLGANVVLVLSDVVKEAAVRHKLCDKLDGRSKADSQQAAHMGIVNASHHISFLSRKRKDILKQPS